MPHSRKCQHKQQRRKDTTNQLPCPHKASFEAVFPWFAQRVNSIHVVVYTFISPSIEAPRASRVLRSGRRIALDAERFVLQPASGGFPPTFLNRGGSGQRFHLNKASSGPGCTFPGKTRSHRAPGGAAAGSGKGIGVPSRHLPQMRGLPASRRCRSHQHLAKRAHRN